LIGPAAARPNSGHSSPTWRNPEADIRKVR
jgi:hypothetical protein